jgi:SAM-dependent methyltransferase
MSLDRDAVRAFELQGWERAAARYPATFGRVTADFVEALLDAARVAAGDRVLDIACGPGPAAASAARRGARGIGIDFAGPMLEKARALHPGLPLVAGDAEALPFAAGAFDAVVANFGIHHAADPVRALKEARRVLRPGGRIAFTSWADPEENLAWKLLFGAIAAAGEKVALTAPPSGGGLKNARDALAALTSAGFDKAEIGRERRHWVFLSPAELIASFREGTVRTGALIAAQPRRALPAIEAEIARLALPYRNAGSYAVPIVALLATARTPS